MKLRFIPLTVLSLILLTSCSNEENPYRMEMNGLLQENEDLREQLGKMIEEQQEANNGIDALQNSNRGYREEIDKLNSEIEELSQQNTQLSNELQRIEVQRKQYKEQQAELRRQQEAQRQQQLQAIAKANESKQPPFRVFDVVYIGKKQHGTFKENVGRFSVRNHTDEPLKVTAWYKLWPIAFDVPPNSASNRVIIRAEKGDELKVKAGSHEESITW